MPVRSVRQYIWEQGWTEVDMRRATVALVCIVAGRSHQVDQEDRELAAELTRWLRYGSIAGAEWLVQSVQEFRPLQQDAPHWDELDALLDRGRTERDIGAVLAEQYADPVKTLIALLNEAAPPGVMWEDEVESPSTCAHRRAFEALIAFGTTESLTYVLSRLDLFDWEAGESLEHTIRRHGAAIKTVAFDVWPALTWTARARIIVFLEAYGFIDDNIRQLLLTVDVGVMNRDDKVGYLDALGNCCDERVLPRIHELLDRALADMVAGVPGAHAIVRVAYRQYDKLETEPTASQQQLAAEHGVRWMPQTLCWCT